MWLQLNTVVGKKIIINFNNVDEIKEGETWTEICIKGKEESTYVQQPFQEVKNLIIEGL